MKNRHLLSFFLLFSSSLYSLGGFATDRTDNFNRTDSALSINSPSDGGSNWTIPTATAVWGISSNTAYAPVSVSQDIVVLESSVSDVDVQMTLVTKGTDTGIIARETDDNNYLLVTTSGSNSIYRRDTGSFVLLGTFSMAVSNNDVMKFSVSGTSLTIYQNGASRGTATSSFNQTATKHGLRTNSDTAARFDTFSITATGGTTAAPRMQLRGVGP